MRDHIEMVDAETQAVIKIVFRDMSDGGPKSYYAKSRVYVFGVENLPELVIEDVTLPDPQVLGVDPENDKAYVRRNRLYAKKTCEVAHATLERLAEVSTLNSGIKLRFSRKAGCSCGCSPGVIADGTLHVDGRPFDLFITLVDHQEPAL